MSKFTSKGGTVEHKNPGFVDQVVQAFDDPPDIAIGFPMGKASSIQYPDGTPLIDVAVYNNYGTFNKDGSVHIPPRPFMDVGGLNASLETKKMRQVLLKRVREGKIKMVVAADMIGAKAAAIMKRTIRDFDDPPNAPATIKKKKSSNPLVDTGLLMQSVTWELRKHKREVEIPD